MHMLASSWFWFCLSLALYLTGAPDYIYLPAAIIGCVYVVKLMAEEMEK